MLNQTYVYVLPCIFTGDWERVPMFNLDAIFGPLYRLVLTKRHHEWPWSWWVHVYKSDFHDRCGTTCRFVRLSRKRTRHKPRLNMHRKHLLTKTIHQSLTNISCSSNITLPELFPFSVILFIPAFFSSALPLNRGGYRSPKQGTTLSAYLDRCTSEIWGEK